ncbi:MAG TPA: LysE family translocator [Chromatiales bacterium]|nr:LysE family translocator [Chromatiales bacterium]
MTEYLVSAAVLGLAGGFGPGPLMTLVISESLTHGLRAGVKVSIAPLLTDAPIIALSLLLIARLQSNGWILGAISMAGGVVVMRIGLYDLRRGASDVDTRPRAPRSLQRGILVNALNPHPYIFWFSVGAPIVVRAAHSSTAAAVAFVSVFYALLVGSKVVLTLLAAKSRGFLSGRAFDVTIRTLGVLMILFSLLLIRDGISLIAGAM